MSNKNTFYAYKSLILDIKDIDDSQGIVTGYFSAFNSKDSDGDIIRKGAFAKSINEKGPSSTGNRKIKHLFQHDVNKPIGMIKELTEDNYGLRFVSKMSEATLGQDVLKMYKEGILNEHSIGFQTIKQAFNKKEGYNEITEVKLWEGSTVTFGANQDTPVESIKSEKDLADRVTSLNDRMNKLIKALKHGNYTDETMLDFEIQLKQVQQSYNSLITYKPSADTLSDDKSKESKLEDQRKQLLINLIQQKNGI